jgi:hypothetical protein
MKLLFIYLVLVLVIAFYIWINVFKEGNQDSDAQSIHNLINTQKTKSTDRGSDTTDQDTNVLTSNKVTPGITSIDRYSDENCPVKNNNKSYIYCVDGQIECQDIFGSTISGNLTSISTNDEYKFGTTFKNTCGSYINKSNLSDYTTQIGSSVTNTKGVYFDLSNCNTGINSGKPWRVGGTNIDNIDDKGKRVSKLIDFSCYPSQLQADQEWNDRINSSLNKGVTYKVNDNVFVSSYYLNSPNFLNQGVPAMLSVIDANKPNTQSAYRTINGQKYYQASIHAVTGNTYTILLSNLPKSSTKPLMIKNIPKNALLKDSLYNPKTNDYYSDLTSSKTLRPVCKSGRFTSCLSKPPFSIENGAYVPTSDPLVIDGSYNMYRKQSQIDMALKTPFSDTPNNPSGIIDRDNLLEYNYFSESKDSSTPFIKCVANYGSRVGDPLCCNQNGKLPDTKHICPQEVPTCVGYSISDNVFGYCS